MVTILDISYFLLRYIPFWAIPLMLISLQFSYTFWLKDIRRACYGFAGIAFICFLFLIFFFWRGSPGKSSQFLEETIRTYEHNESQP